MLAAPPLKVDWYERFGDQQRTCAKLSFPYPPEESKLAALPAFTRPPAKMQMIKTAQVYQPALIMVINSRIYPISLCA